MRENLMVLAQTYANANGWALSTVSKQIHGKHSFLEDFFAGKTSTTLKTYYRMVNQLRRDWPRGIKWPATRPIPKLGKKPDGSQDA